MCDGNCKSCPIQCGASTVRKMAEASGEKENKKETVTMSEAFSCKTSENEKVSILVERSVGARHMTTICLALAIINLLLIAIVVICLQPQFSAMRVDIRENRKDIIALKEDSRRIEFMALDAQRGYNNARKTLQRVKDASQ